MALFNDKNAWAVLTRAGARERAIKPDFVQMQIQKIDSLLSQVSTMNAYKSEGNPHLIKAIDVLTDCKKNLHQVILPYTAQAETETDGLEHQSAPYQSL